MVWFKRISFFLLLNFAIVLMCNIVLSILGVERYLTPHGISYSNLLASCLVWGMTISLFSLALSKQAAKWVMGVRTIDPNTQVPDHRWLLENTHLLAKRAGLKVMPDVAIFESQSPNAFATGPSKKRSLIAVSTGLLRSMEQDEILAVIGHEVAHIANGDMVTMALLQGVVNAFVMFLARIVAYAVSSAISGRSRDSRSSAPSPLVYYMLIFVFECVFMFFGYMVIAFFSRLREYRADRGGAEYAGKVPMISALKALQRSQQTALLKTAPIRGLSRESGFEMMQISSQRKWLRLLSTHPPLEKRIARLELSDMREAIHQA